MTRKAHKQYTLPEILADYPDEICDLAMELREFVRETAPDARETIRWRGISYTRPEEKGFVKGGVCGIGLYEDHVRLVLIHGAFLPDPDGLLESDEGRLHMRYVPVRKPTDIRRPAFRDLIQASWRHRPTA